MATYLQNAWYAAALGRELTDEGAVGRMLLGDHIVLYRTSSGDPVALFDRCPHRFAQLHLGEVVEDQIQCPYHGLRFNPQGACAFNPHGSGAIPTRASVRSYPVVERHGAVWIWMGDRNLADPSLIPELRILDHSDQNARACDRMHILANYELVTDNLMDLSHADFVHTPREHRNGHWGRLKADVTRGERSIRSVWSHRTDQLPPFFRATLRHPDGMADQVFDMTWRAPSNMLLRITVRHADYPLSAGAEYAMALLVTPETEASCHMFVLTVRNWSTNDADLNAEMMASLMHGLRSEDQPILESVQRSMGTADLWSLDPLSFGCDSGGVQARRKLRQLIEAEKDETGSDR